MEIRNPETAITPGRVTVRESDLLEAWIVALESGEFRQIRGMMRDNSGGRCAFGVLYEVLHRAGYRGAEPEMIVGALGGIDIAAGGRLGHSSVDAANDAGVPFAAIAQSLRDARNG